MVGASCWLLRRRWRLRQTKAGLRSGPNHCWSFDGSPFSPSSNDDLGQQFRCRRSSTVDSRSTCTCMLICAVDLEITQLSNNCLYRILPAKRTHLIGMTMQRPKPKTTFFLCCCPQSSLPSSYHLCRLFRFVFALLARALIRLRVIRLLHFLLHGTSFATAPLALAPAFP